ncbi:hypothetical protein [Pseudoalteromonas rhizosphaerae]
MTTKKRKKAKLENTSAQELEFMLIHKPNELLRGITELQQKLKELSK